ncbi:restriction endonuclease subunit S [Butyricicoccus sp. AM78-15b2TA]|jgi:type I restriction enzyme S subunit|uniref:restriction endonuclease subunit S n=1 Tax=Butyricicoccus sp. AM78-15b2TA TaxID=3002516 RepID=UPI0022E3528A|nr:restriction endonuclease subunit S [Butyricicoccus sp. AM78-15b2TA]
MANVSSSNGLEKRPKLRFPGFDEPWRAEKLSDFAERVTRKNSNNETDLPLTISSKDGLVDQISYFNKTVASKDMSGYYLLRNGEYAYNKSYSVGYDFGSIKRLDRYPMGALSTLYICFALKKHDTDFIKVYFDSLKWYKEIYMISAEGARNHGLLNVPTDEFFATKHYLPENTAEQRKIADFLIALDRRIDAQQSLVDALKKYKRGLLNQIFSAISKGSQRRKLRELVHVSGGKTPSMSNSLYWNGDIVWISSKDMKSSRISGSELKITNLALNEMTLYHPGTLLLVARSGILKHSLPLAILEVDATINQDIKALQVHGCNAFYLYYAILSQEDNIIRTLVKTGTTVQSLMMDSFLNIEIPTPNIDQQQSIIDKLAKLEKYVDVQGKELSLLSQMRNGLLQQLFI